MSTFAAMSQAGYTVPATATSTLVTSTASPTVVMPTAAPVMQSVTMPAQPAPVTYMQAAPAPAPTYVYPAGSAGVPVYGSSVAVPQFYQQPAAAMPTVAYQPSQQMTQEQLNTIFP
eukprot:CAMPEP_0171209120 /NCGR_PEP_ID=MMETSP0790-20130122/28434_1 /TAXON_ID=2925 /ORGANISM="Alexandrium catenella, Strain OF101" /LENGTH=115 /DNA_ID=CAMNT_0011674725 /DNA_START=86 /DNA_END=429 /DNA_ORIENTATION=+